MAHNGCCYLIDNCVEFWPDDNLLHSRINGEEITLFVAASRCFELLLNQQGSLVLQQDLFDVGWQKNAPGVSNNTLYQNILMLRKGLKHAGYEHTVIKTVPRQGLMIPATVPVEKIMQHGTAKHTEPLPIIENNPPEVPSNIRISNNNQPRHQWFMVLGLSLIAGLILFAIWSGSAKKNFFSNFHYIGQIDQCSVYLYSSRTTLESFMQFIAQKEFTCNKLKFIYFSTYPLVPRASVIRCERPFSAETSNSCISEYHLEWQHHE
ncbi:MAG: winged helix-turn-helix domain-containing protein [Enterobacterales bacterium]|uniref:winged helix-turn-helix domain-containing protein n=1 Tax=Serratia sp. (in: enterobacteria) TaxID=616 RepID=UPI003F2F4AEB